MSRRVILWVVLNFIWGVIAGALGFAIFSGDPKQIAVVLLPTLMITAALFLA